MPGPPESWAELGKRVEPTRFHDLRWFDEIDSTNRYLLDEARAGAPEGAVAVADHQTAGRGRLGRAWTAPPGSSLLVSVLLRPPLGAAQAHIVTMATGVAACEAVFLAAGFAPSLKWPNDLVVGRLKLAGMLSEAEIREGRLEALVVGIGINVNWTDFPPEIVETATACNLVTGESVDRVELLARLLERLDDRYATLLEPGGADALLGEYRARCTTIGRTVRVELAGETFEGTAVAVNEAGHLLVQPVEPHDASGPPREVTAGDVVHLRS